MIGFLGIGQCGGNICDVAEIHEFPTGVINTSPEDLESLRLVKNKLHIGKEGGAGKDRRIAKREVKTEYKRIVDFVNLCFDEDTTMIYVVFSMDGGTGSGASPLIIDMLNQLIPNKTFGYIGVIPSQKLIAASQFNFLDCMREVNDLNVPGFFIDNGKAEKLRPGTRKQVYDYVNEQIILDIESLYEDRESTKYGNIDQKDISKLITTPHNTMIIRTEVKEVTDGRTIQKQILESIEKSIYAPLDFDKVIKRMGLIVSIEDKLTKQINLDELYQSLGSPLEVFEGYYNPDKEEGNVIITILAGLSIPEERASTVVRKLEKSKETYVPKKDSSAFKTDMTWFSDIRDDASVKRNKSVINEESSSDDLGSLFDRY